MANGFSFAGVLLCPSLTSGRVCFQAALFNETPGGQGAQTCNRCGECGPWQGFDSLHDTSWNCRNFGANFWFRTAQIERFAWHAHVSLTQSYEMKWNEMKWNEMKWQMTNDKWQMTNDKWQMTNDLINFQKKGRTQQTFQKHVYIYFFTPLPCILWIQLLLIFQAWFLFWLSLSWFVFKREGSRGSHLQWHCWSYTLTSHHLRNDLIN